MSAAIQVGVNHKTIEALRASISDILLSSNSDQVKMSALDTLKHGSTVSGATVSGCNVYTVTEES